MANLRANLQRSLFQSDEERLLCFVNVTKLTEKKKSKETYLCATGKYNNLMWESYFTASIQKPVVLKLFIIRAKDGGFYKKETINVRDVKIVDGINPRKVSVLYEFVMYLGPNWVWYCFKWQSKKEFLRRINFWKRFFHQRTLFGKVKCYLR